MIAFTKGEMMQTRNSLLDEVARLAGVVIDRTRDGAEALKAKIDDCRAHYTGEAKSEAPEGDVMARLEEAMNKLKQGQEIVNEKLSWLEKELQSLKDQITSDKS